MAVTSNTGTAATGTSTAPAITVPAGVSVGDVVVVHIGFNNTNLMTGRPTGLTQIGTNPFTGTTQGTSEIYWGVVDGSTIAAGTALTWALSATRQWSVTLEAYSGVDNTNPIHQSNLVARTTTTTTHTSPTITTTVTSHILELAYAKPSTGTLTSATPPAGYSTLQSIYPASSFSATVTQAEQATDQAAGAYGGDNWTTSVSTNPEAIYTLALLPAATSPAFSGSVTLTGAGTLSNTGSPAIPGTAGPAGAGTLALTGTPTAQGATALGGTGTLTLTGAAAAAGTLALSGTGTLDLSGAASGNGAGTINLAGTGTLAPAGQPNTNGTISLAGTGTLTTAGKPASAGAVALTATGGLTLSGKPGQTGALNFTGTGTLTLAGVAGGVPVDVAFTAEPLTDRWESEELAGRWTITAMPDRFTPAPLADRWISALTDGDTMTTDILTSAGAKKYVGGTITETTGKDISGDVFQISLGSATNPGTWVTPDISAAGTTPNIRTVKLLVSSTTPPGITNGCYYAWVRITDSPEIEPIRVQGPITIR